MKKALEDHEDFFMGRSRTAGIWIGDAHHRSGRIKEARTKQGELSWVPVMREHSGQKVVLHRARRRLQLVQWLLR